jgi:hypothetical protein
VVGRFPDRDATIRLSGPVLARENDEWTEWRRFIAWRSPAASRKAARFMVQNITYGVRLTIETVRA